MLVRNLLTLEKFLDMKIDKLPCSEREIMGKNDYLTIYEIINLPIGLKQRTDILIKMLDPQYLPILTNSILEYMLFLAKQNSFILDLYVSRHVFRVIKDKGIYLDYDEVIMLIVQLQYVVHCVYLNEIKKTERDMSRVVYLATNISFDFLRWAMDTIVFLHKVNTTIFDTFKLPKLSEKE